MNNDIRVHASLNFMPGSKDLVNLAIARRARLRECMYS